MKALVLGGAGAMCSETTRDLVNTSNLTEITIGDVDEAKAKRLAAELKDKRVSVLQINVLNWEKLLDTLKQFDVVVNGLPFKYDVVVTKAAIEAQIDGIDLSSSAEQLALDPQAKKAGITFVMGCGQTPGVTNVMVRRAATQLDQVHEVQIAWASYRCFAPARGLVDTTLWEFDPDTKERAIYQDGKYISQPPFGGAKIVNFPKPYGPLEVYYVPHPESETIPRYMKEVKKVEVRGTWPPQVMRLLRMMLEYGLFRKEPIKINGTSISPSEMFAQYIMQVPEGKANRLWGYALHVEVTGAKDGSGVKYTYTTTHPPMEQYGGTTAYAKNVGIPLSVGAQMLARGDVKEKGVLSPEACIDPTIFFAELAKRGIIVHEKLEAL